ncbi:zinc uptake protein ZrgA [Pelagimonas varians]|uniref:DUF2796 domain-containing protein n=1 Tax=Pelagimonas varians TaxID=696760 RepID=A0A238KVM6_9RHOB|nr:DUF2796 domain-containing protein [Pelagimonas varians]PYG28094.1 uncharacterized protein DUF2796 [Pelagimonas varians]SMX46757.1 hypothetical protein PEV8663_03376 [Pelagimonas varians]
MKFSHLFVLAVISGAPAFSETARQLDAHEHGVGQLNIAFDGAQVAMELNAPGADVVGFEYAAKSAQDRAAVDAAVGSLARPLELFVLPDAAGCSVVQAAAELEVDHEEEHVEGHEEDDHGHDDHAEDEHDDHDEEAGHTEFHAEYLLTCAKPTAITDITFAYFDVFPNAREVEVQIISDSGATSFEVERDAPVLNLHGMF